MSNTFKSNIPTSVKGNQDLLDIITTDIDFDADELKKLVAKMLQESQEIKADQSNRLDEAKMKIAELDHKMSQLNYSDTFLNESQLDDTLARKHKIFLARQEIHFFETKQAPLQLETLEEIYQNLVSTVDILNSYEDNYSKGVADNSKVLYLSQAKITNDVLTLMNKLFEFKISKVQRDVDQLADIHRHVDQLEADYYDYIDHNISEYSSLQDTSSTHFSAVDDDLFINEKIIAEYEDMIQELNTSIEVLTTEYETEKEIIIKAYKNHLKEITKDDKVKNADEIKAEREKEEKYKDELKAIKLQILAAEKKDNYSLVSKLLKKYDNAEKRNPASTSSNQLSKETQILLEKTKDNANNQLLVLEKEYATSLNRFNYDIALEKVKFDEAKILYKIKADHQGLQEDLQVNDERVLKLKEFVEAKVTVGAKILSAKLQLRQAELQIMKENELLELDLIDEYKELLIALKRIENKYFNHLKQNLNNYLIVKYEQEYQVNKNILDLKLSREISNLETDLVTKRNELWIQNEEYRSNAESEIAYQESCIELAKKEHDIKLAAIKEHYTIDSSHKAKAAEAAETKALATNAAVTSDLRNQINASTQAIEAANKEFEFRVQSIQQKMVQEHEDLNSKIVEFRQKYTDEKALINQELKKRTKDYNLKLMLFTEGDVHLEIKQKIEELTTTFQEKIAKIEAVEQEDEQIILYEEKIEEATSRARASIKEAQDKKESALKTSTELLDIAQRKYDAVSEPSLQASTTTTKILAPQKTLESELQAEQDNFHSLIAESKRIIHENKAFCDSLDKQMEENETIQDILDQKDQILATYHEECRLLALEKDKGSKALDANLDDLSVDNQMDIAAMRNTLFQNMSYRNKEDIDKDYEELAIKEKDLYNTHLSKFENYKTDFIKRIEDTSTRVKAVIQASLLPYDKYIEYASKGLVATKKDLETEYDKLLKQSINEINNKFKRDAFL